MRLPKVNAQARRCDTDRGQVLLDPRPVLLDTGTILIVFSARATGMAIGNHPRDYQPHDYLTALKTGRWFSVLPEPMQQALLADAQIKTLAQQQVLFSRGDAFDGIYCVVKGALRITGSTAAGKEALLTVIEPYNWIGEIALFDGLARTHDAIATQASVLVNVPQASLDAMLTEHPSWWRWFGLLLTYKMRVVFVAMEDAALLTAPQRVARRLVFMAEGYGEFTDRSRRVLPLPQEQLAAMLSLSRQTINQVLRQFEAQGLLKLHYRELEVLDLGGLREAGCETPAKK